MLTPSRFLQLAKLGFPLCGFERLNMRHSSHYRKQPGMLLLLGSPPSPQNDSMQGSSYHKKRNRRQPFTAHDAGNMSPCLAVGRDFGADCTDASMSHKLLSVARPRHDQVEPPPLSLSPGHGVDCPLIWTSWKGSSGPLLKGLYTGKRGDTRVPLWVETRGSGAEESLDFELFHTSQIESFAVPPSA